MKIGIFDPYLDTLGGGERYVLSIADYLSSNNEVHVFWDDKSVKEKAKKKFKLDLTDVIFTQDIFSKKTNLATRYLTTHLYDIIIYLSDGSIPFLFAKKNILLLHFPVVWVNTRSVLSKLKLKNIQMVICYSEFVKGFLTKSFDIPVNVIAPAVSSVRDTSVKKENIILTVGRFTTGKNRKKQEVLIAAFKKLYDQGIQDWKLVIIGSYIASDKDFVDQMKELVRGYPIDILTDAPYETLVKIYNKAKIYWHAAGYGEDLKKKPENAEHFGISTVEAMSAGCAVIVFNGGGQPEIVTHNKNGFLWNTEEELINITKRIQKDDDLRETLAKEAEIRAKDFADSAFHARIDEMMHYER